jgi:hypothetical protein
MGHPSELEWATVRIPTTRLSDPSNFIVLAE